MATDRKCVNPALHLAAAGAHGPRHCYPLALHGEEDVIQESQLTRVHPPRSYNFELPVTSSHKLQLSTTEVCLHTRSDGSHASRSLQLRVTSYQLPMTTPTFISEATPTARNRILPAANNNNDDIWHFRRCLKPSPYLKPADYSLSSITFLAPSSGVYIQQAHISTKRSQISSDYYTPLYGGQQNQGLPPPKYHLLRLHHTKPLRTRGRQSLQW